MSTLQPLLYGYARFLPSALFRLPGGRDFDWRRESERERERKDNNLGSVLSQNSQQSLKRGWRTDGAALYSKIFILLRQILKEKRHQRPRHTGVHKRVG